MGGEGFRVEIVVGGRGRECSDLPKLLVTVVRNDGRPMQGNRSLVCTDNRC